MTRTLTALALATLMIPGAAAAQAHVLVIAGLGGEPKYVDDFHNWGVMMVDAARDRLGLPPENVVFLSEDPQRDPARVSGESRKENVEQAIAAMFERSAPGDRIMILLLGHGSADSRGSRVNLPGPDLTAEDYARLISAFDDRPLAFINAASSSGDFQEALAGPNRTIITATRSGMERNETMFGGFFVTAFARDGADADRNGRVTLEEAFQYATTETARAYETSNRLQMENARMEGDLELAKVFHVNGTAGAVPGDASPAARALYTRRQELEESVDRLRIQSGQMDPAEYTRELERLLLELARTNREIQEIEGNQ